MAARRASAWRACEPLARCDRSARCTCVSALARQATSHLLGDHVDGSAGTLLGAEPAALAEVEIDAEPLAGAELDHGVVRADAEAVVALEAVAARQAAPGLEQRIVLVEPTVD